MSILGKNKNDKHPEGATVKVSNADFKDQLKGYHLTIASSTDVGKQRNHNEDNHLVMNLNSCQVSEPKIISLISTQEKGALLMVTDGMGGAAAGDVASSIVKDTLRNWFEKKWCKSDLEIDDLPNQLQSSVSEANKKVFKLAQKNSKYSGMGATITACAVINNKLFVVQVGDSRCYLLRNNRLIQVTRDQSLVNKLVESGNITREEARHHQAKNVILQAIGVAQKLEVGFYTLSLKNTDALLLCSDGLTDMVSDDMITTIINDNSKDLLSATNKLIDEANKAGGKDNITVIIANFSTGDAEDATDDESMAKTRKVNADELDVDKILDKTSRYVVPPEEEK